MTFLNDMPLADAVSFQQSATFYMMGLITWHCYINCVLFGIAVFVLYFFSKNLIYWTNTTDTLVDSFNKNLKRENKFMTNSFVRITSV
jgi:hypothetical protein